MRKRPLCFVCMMFLLIQSVIYMCWSGKKLDEIPASSIFYDEKEISIEGQVYKKEIKSKYQILYLKNNSVYDSQVMIYDENFIKVAIGQRIALCGETILFEDAPNPGNFNQKQYYAKQGFYGAIWCKKVLWIKGNANEFLENLFQLKCKWKEQLILCLGQEEGGILSAILLGDKGELHSDTKELYQVNGIGHILAISGLHVTFLGLGIYSFLRKIGLPPWFSGLCAGILLMLYGTMVGWGISIIRAVIMLLIKMGADISGRMYDTFTALSVAASVNVILNPFCFSDPAFYLSYGAIVGIALLNPVLECQGKAAVAITMFLLPLNLWFYYEIPLHSVMLNMIVIPLSSIALGCGFIGSIFLIILWPIGNFVLQLSGWILKLFYWICYEVSWIPYIRMVIGKPKLWMVLVYYGLLILFVVCRRNRSSKKRVTWLIFLVALFVLTWRNKEVLTITMMDVGQGDGIFIQGPKGGTYLIDGGSSDVDKLGKYRIESFLKYQGVGELDYVFVTHGDVDHYSGIVEMIRRRNVGIRIHHLVLPLYFEKDEELVALRRLAMESGVEVLVMKEGDRLEEGELKIGCLQPTMQDSKLEGNAGSLIMELEYRKFSMLFTGDVEGEGEERLISRLKNKNYVVLKVSHHGSRNSTSTKFIESIRPQYALLSAGKNNLYGHPHEETIQRLEKAGCKVFSTIKNGAITIRSDGNSLTFY